MAGFAKSIDRLNLAELVALRERVHKAIAAKVADERQSFETKLTDLIGDTPDTRQRKTGAKTGARVNAKTAKRVARGSRKGTRVQPKYRGPNGEKWSGRGLAPRWLVALEKTGKKRETYLIKR